MFVIIVIRLMLVPVTASGSAVDLAFKANTDDWALLSGSLEGVLKCCMSELKGD